MKMKSRILTLCMILLSSTILFGCESNPNNQETGDIVEKIYNKGEIDQKGASINPKSIVGYVGVMKLRIQLLELLCIK